MHELTYVGLGFPMCVALAMACSSTPQNRRERSGPAASSAYERLLDAQIQAASDEDPDDRRVISRAEQKALRRDG